MSQTRMWNVPPQPTPEQLAQSRRLLTATSVILAPIGVALLIVGVWFYLPLVFLLGVSLVICALAFAVTRPLLLSASVGRRLAAAGIIVVLTIVIFGSVILIPGPMAARGLAQPSAVAEQALLSGAVRTFGDGEDVLMAGMTADRRHLTYDLSGETTRSIDLAEGERVKISPDGEFVYVEDGTSTRAYDRTGAETGRRPGVPIAFRNGIVVMYDSPGGHTYTGFDARLRAEAWALDSEDWPVPASGPHQTLDRGAGSTLDLGPEPYVLPEHLMMTGVGYDDGMRALELVSGELVVVDGTADELAEVISTSRDGALVEATNGEILRVDANVDTSRLTVTYSAEVVEPLPVTDGIRAAVGPSYVVVDEDSAYVLVDGGWTSLPITDGRGPSSGGRSGGGGSGNDSASSFGTDGSTLLVVDDRTVSAYALDEPGVPMVWEQAELPCEPDTEISTVGHGAAVVACAHRNPIPGAIDLSDRALVFDADDGERRLIAGGDLDLASIIAVPNGIMLSEKAPRRTDPADVPIGIYRH